MKVGADFRNAKIAKIKIASKTLALDDGSYRALLTRVTGKDSAAKMTERELDSVIKEFERLGFKAKKKRAGDRKMANHAQAGKIRALWIMLYHMAAVDEPSENALAKFVKRTCGVEDLHWIGEYHADQTIRALRGWLVRLGYTHPTADHVKRVSTARAFAGVDGEDSYAIAAKLNLIGWQMKKLSINDIAIGGVAYTSHGCLLADNETLDCVIEKLGAYLRK